MQTILVTGAAGLIGRRVLMRLRETGRRALGVDVVLAPSDLPSEIVDLKDAHRLHALALEHKIDSVIHCGAVSGPMVMIDNPIAIVEINIMGTGNILELARIHRMRRVVFCSSTSAYGRTPPPANDTRGLAEDTPLRPTSVYGATKVAGEALVSAYRSQHGVDGVAVRLCWVYGPGRTTACVVRTMIEDAQAGRPTHLPFGADFPRQFIHVDDAVDALLAAHDADHCPGDVYNATGGDFTTIGEVAARVRDLIPEANITVAEGPDPLDDYQHRFDIAAIGSDLGFRPARPLERGLADYAQWIASKTA